MRGILKERFPLIYQEDRFQRGDARAHEYYSNLGKKEPIAVAT